MFIRKLMYTLSVSSLLLFTLAAHSNTQSHDNATCTDGAYGSSSTSTAIEDVMYDGTLANSITAIESGKAVRGANVGCTVDAWPHALPNTSKPTLFQLESLWVNTHGPGLDSYAHTCAALGRSWPAAALGGLYAKLAGYSTPFTDMQTMARQVRDTQYWEVNAPTPLVTYEGLFSYSTELANSKSGCYRSGTVASQINQWCAGKSSVCVTYTNGLWAGEQFLVEDFSISPREYGGAAAYDHAWTAILMSEMWLQETDPLEKAKYEQAALKAADWSKDEPAVRNHNYTAKNIWVLAQMYSLTGNSNLRNALVEKLDKSLKPGVLMDANSDGYVDGMQNQLFSDLTLTAQTPGRMWDGHNSNPWYHSMNTWAAVESYVAFRDHGDVALANGIKPYMEAMLDNLATELTTQGPPFPPGEHMWPIPYSLLTALWKVSAYENMPRPLWEDAAATLYNWGLFDTFDAGVNNLSGRATSSLGLYLLYTNGTAYVPLIQRLNLTPKEKATSLGVKLLD